MLFIRERGNFSAKWETFQARNLFNASESTKICATRAFFFLSLFSWKFHDQLSRNFLRCLFLMLMLGYTKWDNVSSTFKWQESNNCAQGKTKDNAFIFTALWRPRGKWKMEHTWAQFHGSAYSRIRLRSWFPAYMQASNLCASVVSLECLVTHAQKPTFAATPEIRLP